MSIYEDIYNDSFLKNISDDDVRGITIDELQDLLPNVRNIDLVVKIYKGNYLFSNKELILLALDLKYMGSSKLFDVLVIMKYIDFIRQEFNFTEYLTTSMLLEYNSVDFVKINLERSKDTILIPINDSLLSASIYYNLTNLFEYLFMNPKTNDYFVFDKTQSLYTQLFNFASLCGSLEIVKYLVETSAFETTAFETATIQTYTVKPTTKTETFESILEKSIECASKSGNITLVKLLLKAKNFSVAPLRIGLENASTEGHTEIVLLLLDTLKSLPENAFDCLREASFYNHLEITKIFLDKGVDVRKDYDILFQNACEFGHLEMAQLLLKRGSNLHECGEYALRKACHNNHLDIIKFLLKNGADPTLKDSLDWAYYMNQYEILTLLIEYGADIRANDDEYIHYSFKYNDLEMIEFLLDNDLIDLNKIEDYLSYSTSSD